MVPISCVEWDLLNGDTKALYIQQKLDMRVASATAVLGGVPPPVAPVQSAAPGPLRPLRPLMKPLPEDQARPNIQTFRDLDVTQSVEED